MSAAWLDAHVPSFQHLSDAERSAIGDFTLLWTLFEARVLATRGSAQRISDAVEKWEQAGSLEEASYAAELAYFRDRYFAAGDFTHHFDGLNLRPIDQPALVRAVLDGSDNHPRNRLTAIMIIVLRYRNNLFHGVKWQYHLADQLNNFSHANSILMRALEQHGNLQGA